MRDMLLQYSFKCFTVVNEKDIIQGADVEVDNFAKYLNGDQSVRLVYRPENQAVLRSYLGSVLDDAAFAARMSSNPKALVTNPFRSKGVADFLVEVLGDVDKVFESYQFRYTPPAPEPVLDEVSSSRLREDQGPVGSPSVPSGFGVGSPAQMNNFSQQSGNGGSSDSVNPVVMQSMQSLSNLLGSMDTMIAVLSEQNSRSLGRFEEFDDEDFKEFTYAYDNVPAQHVKIGFKHIIQTLWQNKNEEVAQKLMTEFLGFLETKDSLFKTVNHND